MNLDHLIKRKIWLAPLAGLTDRAFRLIAKQNGADVLVSEMVSADGLVHDYEKSIRYALFSESERPFGIQLFGSKAETMSKAAKIIIKLCPDFIDINMGCPVKKVVKKGAGAALMTNLEAAESIIRAVKDVVRPQNIPLSVKFRSGWDKLTINAVEFSIMCENAGADFLCIHPRTRSQMFSGKSDWNVIKRVKESTNLPVIGNGDICSVQDATRIYESTQCDSIMIGRAAVSRPWLIKCIKEFLLTQKFTYPDSSYILSLIKVHYDLKIKYKGLDNAIKEMRTHICHYTKGLRGGSALRSYINTAVDYDKIMQTLERSYG